MRRILVLVGIIFILLLSASAQTVSAGVISGGSSGRRQHAVQLNWTAPSGTVTSYNVYKSQSSGSFGTAYQTGITTTAFLDRKVNDGQTYYYAVTAVNSSGEGPKSTQISANIPTP
jgi:fibronectin type 3 domain-containing protein